MDTYVYYSRSRNLEVRITATNMVVCDDVVKFYSGVKLVCVVKLDEGDITYREVK